ncbi:MAG: energy transducer TonB [Balneola sp.]
MSINYIALAQMVLFILCVSNTKAQEISTDKSGIETTTYDKIVSYYDPFTDHLAIEAHEVVLVELNKSITLKMSPLFNGSQECYQWECESYTVVIASEDTSIVEFLDLTEVVYSQKKFPVLFSNERDQLTVFILSENHKFKNDLEDITSTKIAVEFNFNQLDKLIESESTRIRINGTVISFGEKVKSIFFDIRKILTERRSQYKSEPKEEEGENLSPPYELKWEGNIQRDPLVQPLPQNTANTEGVISVRFQVKPDGSVGMIIPLKKMNEELEKEVQRTLRSWKFSKLPSGTPQQAQWGTITFRFVF